MRSTTPGTLGRSAVGRLHVITDTTVQSLLSHAQLAERAIAGGADTIQYRSKGFPVRTMLREALEVRNVCVRNGVTFIVNDRVDIALAVGADGVHLGLDDMPIAVARSIVGPGMLIGGTVRNEQHLSDAVRDGADYVGLGPIFGTTSKVVGVEPLGLSAVARVSTRSPIPVIAIAGIHAGNAAEVLRAGAWGVAVLGAICTAEDIPNATGEIARIVRSIQPAT